MKSLFVFLLVCLPVFCYECGKSPVTAPAPEYTVVLDTAAYVSNAIAYYGPQRIAAVPCTLAMARGDTLTVTYAMHRPPTYNTETFVMYAVIVSDTLIIIGK